PNPGQFICVVAPSSGNFDEPMIEGGGEHQATSGSTIRVKIHSITQLDEFTRDGILLTDTALGLIEIWRQVVSRLMTPWFPTDLSGNILTRDPLMPTGFSFERRDRAIAAIEQDFKLTFDTNVLSGLGPATRITQVLLVSKTLGQVDVYFDGIV